MAKVDTKVLDHNELKFLLTDSLKEYSEDIAYISGKNPYEFAVNKQRYYFLIRNTHSTGKGRSNTDESRIQISRSSGFDQALNARRPIFFLGYSADNNVFTAWNPRIQTERLRKAKKNVSVYSRFSIQAKAHDAGIALYIDDSKQHIPSFRPEYLGLYIENYDAIHQSSEEALLSLIKESDSVEPTEKDAGVSFNIQDKKYIVTHKRFQRDARFRTIVVEQYEHRCAICNVQLELVEAAHIVPHAHERGTDDPQNGICLCVLHHGAYDSGLIFFDSDYNVHVSQERLIYLEKRHRDGGAATFIKGLNKTITVPKSEPYKPAKNFIELGNRIRGVSQ